MPDSVTAPPYLTVLGGGPAGLAAGHFARQHGWSCTVLEAADRVGGNCATVQRGDFRFDLGAHRFHDKDPGITASLKALLGEELHRVSAPSAICLGKQFLTFPPSARELLQYMGGARFAAASLQAVVGRAFRRSSSTDLESFATRAYGPTLARMFLLNYSEKLWGAPCSTLSSQVSGGRLAGLRLSALWNRNGGSNGHFEGAFYYPASGYGRIADRLAESIGWDAIQTGARVTRILHGNGRITHVEINDRERLPVDRVVATLPLGLAVKLFDPPLPDEVRRMADVVRFRHIVLAVWLLDTPSVMPYATVYFPDAAVPFTRVIEPRNRSAAMAPPGKTSLAVEIPCDAGDAVWSSDERTVIGTSEPTLSALGWIDRRRVIDTCVVRIPNAYPVLTADAQRAAAAIVSHLGRFPNLHLIGRNGLFHYGWLHTVLRMANDLVDGLPAPEVDRDASAPLAADAVNW